MNPSRTSGASRAGLLSLVLGGALLLGACSGQADAPPEVATRQDGFEALGAAFKTINDQLKSASPDMAAIGDAAERMEAIAQEVPEWFPAGSGQGEGFDTDALAAIWEQPERFAAASDQLKAATAALRQAAATGDAAAVQAQVPQVGAACKNCHETFRAK